MYSKGIYMRQRLLITAILFILSFNVLLITQGRAQEQGEDSLSTFALKKRSLEELMNMEITIVAKQPQRWFKSPAAVYVISGDDIRRSGARSIPEALRLAPNLRVAQIDSRQWAISARGFNTTTSNKLLVLIDGRIIYTTLYSGVFWDVQDILLEDVDKIEVISGPGGTLWGTNAVNGIINIITKNSSQTNSSPLYLQVGAGAEEKLSGAIRYGGSFNDSGSYRFYLKYFDRDDTRLENGNDAHDSWTNVQTGFRTDYGISSDDAFSLQGDAYHTKANQLLNDMADMEGGNVLAKWNHTISENSALTLQSYFDYTFRMMPDVFGEYRRIFDHQLEYRTQWNSIHELNLGVGIRHGNTQAINSATLAFLPDYTEGIMYNGFIQDIFTVADDIKLTLGSKFTKSATLSFQAQPRISIGWTKSAREFVWASVTNAARTPSRIDRNLYIPGTPPYLLAGGPDFTSEKVIAFETGLPASGVGTFPFLTSRCSTIGV